MPLDIKSVTQPQRSELILAELARKKAARLIAKLLHPLGDERLIDVVVAIHTHEYRGAAPRV